MSSLGLPKALTPLMSVPLKPPPPYWRAFPFQVSGRFTWKFTGGAFGSMGATAPSTLQNSRVAPGVFGSAGTVCISAELMEAPPLGSPISLAAIFSIVRSAQLVADGAAAAVPENRYARRVPAISLCDVATNVNLPIGVSAPERRAMITCRVMGAFKPLWMTAFERNPDVLSVRLGRQILTQLGHSGISGKFPETACPVLS